MRSPIRDVGSPRALTLARECIDECVETHETCIALAASSDPHLPTRVIDCTNPDLPRLVSTEGQRGQYLTLSYVWGGDQVHKTTTGNVSTYERSINISLLPATIRDTIHVTHALGFSSLWVDSLCIIQDSDEDKRREIGRMHHIYRYAHLTIIAASANKVTESFLNDRPPPPCFSASAFNAGVPLPSGDLTLPFICPPCVPAASEPQAGTVYITAMPSRTLTPEEWPYSAHLGHIGTRAWCMQEYLMAPRALIFNARTLQYRCLTATHHVGDSLCDTYDERRLPDILFMRDPPPAQPGSEEWARVHTAWLGVVRDYSHRAASVAADKLVACSAIAEQFYRCLGSDYLAGLWRATLLADMLWSRRWDEYGHYPAAYRAPSWSWAALEGEVFWSGQWSQAFWADNALAKVVRCAVILEDDGLPFGRVTGGSLVLSGTLLPCVLRDSASTAENRRHTILLRSLECARRQQWAEAVNSTLGGSECEGRDVEVDPNLLGTAVIDCEANVQLGRMWVIPLLLAEFSMNGIVVAMANSGAGSQSTHKKARFRRIGYFYYQVEPIREEHRDSAKAARSLAEALKDGVYPSRDIEIV